MPFGLLLSGFARKRLDDIKTELEDAVRAEFGAGAVTDPDGVFAKIIGIFAKPLSDIWELAESIYNSQYPSTADGASLDNVLELSGHTRLAAEATQVWARFDGTDATIIDSGRTLAIASGETFENGSAVTIDHENSLRADVEIVDGGAYIGNFTIDADGTTYTYLAAGDLADQVATGLVAQINDTENITAVDQDLATFIVAGNFAAEYVVGKSIVVTGSTGNDGAYTVRSSVFAGGNTTIVVEEEIPDPTADGGLRKGITAIDNGDGTLRIDIELPDTADDASDYAVDFDLADMPNPGAMVYGTVGTPVLLAATDAAAVDVAAETVFDILTGQSGWTLAIAALGADVGRNIETDAEARVRRAQSLHIFGRGTIEALRSRLLQLDGVDSVLVVENATDAVDSDGRPPHSVECIVEGGLRADIAQEIWGTKPAGIETTGNVSEIITDSQGLDHTIEFSRSIDDTIYVKITVNSWYAEEEHPSDADATALLKTAMTAYGESLTIGKDVIAQRFVGSAFSAVSGIASVTVLVGTTAPPAATTVVIAADHRARFAEDRVTVVLP